MLTYKDFPKLAVKREKLMKELEIKSYEGDRYMGELMEKMNPMNYPKIEVDENGLLPEDKYNEND